MYPGIAFATKNAECLNSEGTAEPSSKQEHLDRGGG